MIQSCDRRLGRRASIDSRASEAVSGAVKRAETIPTVRLGQLGTPDEEGGNERDSRVACKRT